MYCGSTNPLHTITHSYVHRMRERWRCANVMEISAINHTRNTMCNRYTTITLSSSTHQPPAPPHPHTAISVRKKNVKSNKLQFFFLCTLTVINLLLKWFYWIVAAHCDPVVLSNSTDRSIHVSRPAISDYSGDGNIQNRTIKIYYEQKENRKKSRHR